MPAVPHGAGLLGVVAELASGTLMGPRPGAELAPSPEAQEWAHTPGMPASWDQLPTPVWRALAVPASSLQTGDTEFTHPGACCSPLATLRTHPPSPLYMPHLHNAVRILGMTRVQ